MTAHPSLDNRPLLIGVVHLPPLPGAPDWRPPEPQPRRTRAPRPPGWVADAVRDARALAAAGFDAVLVENFGDAPFFKEDVPKETLAALTRAACAVRAAVPPRVAVGVNVLRNDALGALAVASAADLDFIRVNVLAGAVVTDQGLVEGRAAELARMRARLAPQVRILADVRVKHARPLAERPLAEDVADLVGRGGADAVIVTGTGTGAPVDAAHLADVRAAAGAHPVLVGSGATRSTVAALLASADGVIVGTGIKRGGRTRAPVDGRRARAFVTQARSSPR